MTPLTATVLAVLAMGVMSVSASSDTEQSTDFFVPAHFNGSVDATYFTYSQLQKGVLPPPTAGKFGVTKVFANAFVALTGLGVSASLLEFTPNSMNPPHTHPHGTELLYVTSGALTVGFIDSNNKLYEKALVTGDLFVFPLGLVHYQVNVDATKKATAFSAFSSSSPGLISIPSTVFGSTISKAFLAKAFEVKEEVIALLQTPYHKT